MLVQVALVVFAICAMLSLVVDLGYARLTQAQMQNAADAAAIEGLRKRDAVAGDPVASDLQRRTAASVLVQSVFDDDFDPTNGDADYQIGAGPIIELTDGLTSLHAAQTMTVPATSVYEPELQLNQQNEVHGDMVSGRFCYSADPAPSESVVYTAAGTIVCDEPQSATGSYARNDFNPGVDDTAFLVRLRRSNELQEADVASGGPSLPLTFGKGSLIRGDDSASAYSARRDGLTVRATAIADARPALRVGLPRVAFALPGVTPFALRDTFVQLVTPAGIPARVNPANGLICAGSVATCALANAVGGFAANPSAIGTVGRCVLACLPGETPPVNAAVACASLTSVSGYAPVFAQLTSTSSTRIIGFASLVLNRTAACPAGAATPFSVVISRSASAVAPSNATAVVSGTLLPAGLQPEEIRELLDRNLVGAGRINYGPVLVPVVAR